MAKQASINEIKGTIGNITYYKSKRGYKLKKKSSVTKEQIMKGENFLATRQNMSEFTNAANSGKVLKMAVRHFLILAKDGFLNSRLLKIMKEVLNSDRVNGRGERAVGYGDATLIKGFNFNDKANLESLFFGSYKSTIDRKSGVMQLDIDPFYPVGDLSAPPGTTHFRFISSGCEIDFKTGESVIDHHQTLPLPWDEELTESIALIHHVTPESSSPLFLMLGIQFYQEVNGRFYPLKDNRFNSFKVVEVV